jgi:uncharacterized membrane protein
MSTFALLVTLHAVAAVVWVGGMFFAYIALRPAAATFEPSVRLPLWSRTFGRFFPWVWAAIILLPLTGYAMIFGVFRGFANVGLYVHLMQGIGWIMIAIFLHIFFAPYRRMNQAISKADLAEAGRRLGQIRKLIALNLTLGLIVVILASAGSH